MNSTMCCITYSKRASQNGKQSTFYRRKLWIRWVIHNMTIGKFLCDDVGGFIAKIFIVDNRKFIRLALFNIFAVIFHKVDWIRIFRVIFGMKYRRSRKLLWKFSDFSLRKCYMWLLQQMYVYVPIHSIKWKLQIYKLMLCFCYLFWSRIYGGNHFEGTRDDFEMNERSHLQKTRYVLILRI